MKIKQPSARNCFVCGVENPRGLHIHFYETAPDEVTAEFTIPEEYEGYPGILHGGVAAAILDEAAGRSYMGSDPDNSKFMYTAELKVKYKKHIPVGKPIKIVGRQGKRVRWTAEATSAIYDTEGNILAQAVAILVDIPDKLPPADVEQIGWRVYPDEN
jgi:acyl-coenzyme A thioesterase PaaI-like protein